MQHLGTFVRGILRRGVPPIIVETPYCEVFVEGRLNRIEYKDIEGDTFSMMRQKVRPLAASDFMGAQ